MGRMGITRTDYKAPALSFELLRLLKLVDVQHAQAPLVIE